MSKTTKPSKKTSGSAFAKSKLPGELLWLVDSPLFIDSVQIENFYDAVVRPYFRQGIVTIGKGSEQLGELGAELGLGAEFETGKLLELMSALLPKLKVSADGKLSGGGSYKKTSEKRTDVHPITTPQRQLEQLILHYQLFHDERIRVDKAPGNGDTADKDWLSSTWVSDVPRGVVLLEFPRQTKFIPTYGEYENGPKTLFDQLGVEYVDYPPNATTEQKNAYWLRFDRNFNVQRSVEAVEKQGVGRLDVIDFRVPLSDTGETLHLHFQPRKSYSTITFAYKLIRRGFEHGMRLVGTVKSGPAVNVLALYER